MITVIERRACVRYSRQREALLDLLRSTKTHPDAEWLYTGLRKEYPRISLGTVYRNLRQLTDAGEIIELSYGSISHYDGDISPHYHMKCSNCSKIYDIPSENVSINLTTEDGFRIDGINLMLNGICRNCYEKIQYK